jgi:hypothetical protein
MGGFGSGRPSGYGRDTVESNLSIDVNRPHRAGYLRAGAVGTWRWTHDGERVASIYVRAEQERLRLTYRVRIGNGEWERVAEIVRIARVARHFGATRPYFVCPGAVNGIAAAVGLPSCTGQFATSYAGIAMGSRMPARVKAGGTVRSVKSTTSSSALAAMPA